VTKEAAIATAVVVSVGAAPWIGFAAALVVAMAVIFVVAFLSHGYHALRQSEQRYHNIRHYNQHKSKR
jgi:cytochrome c-type biogenesis protein CcmH/NrfG